MQGCQPGPTENTKLPNDHTIFYLGALMLRIEMYSSCTVVTELELGETSLCQDPCVSIMKYT